MLINIKDTKRMIEVANSLNPKWFKSIEYYIDDKYNESFTIIEMGYIKYAFIHNFKSTQEDIKKLHNLLRGTINEAKRLSGKNSK